MVEYFELGGKKRPLLFGSAAFKLMKQRTGVTMAAFLENAFNGEVDGLSDITYCALRLGERHDKIQPVEDYDEMDVAMWMDLHPEGALVFMQKMVDALPKPSAGEGDAEPGEARKIGTGTT